MIVFAGDVDSFTYFLELLNSVERSALFCYIDINPRTFLFSYCPFLLCIFGPFDRFRTRKSVSQS